jgi:hypothetical protein
MDGLISGYLESEWSSRLRCLDDQHIVQARTLVRRWHDRRPVGGQYTIVYRDGLWPKSVDEVYRQTHHPSVLGSREFATIRFDCDAEATRRRGRPERHSATD